MLFLETISIDNHLDVDEEVKILIDNDGDCAEQYIDKSTATNIINHLANIFNISIVAIDD